MPCSSRLSRRCATTAQRRTGPPGGEGRGDDGSWESAHFAAFPPALNYFLAQAIARLGSGRGSHGGKQPPPPIACRWHGGSAAASAACPALAARRPSGDERAG
eukprot:3769724-Prymnesium_polylepis.1